jgi:hypothetical protein
MHKIVPTRSDIVLDFFEQLATAYRLNCVDKELVYSSFSHDAENWWIALGPYVRGLRSDLKDDLIYCEFEAMVRAIHAAYPDEPRPDEQSVSDYLAGERALS